MTGILRSAGRMVVVLALLTAACGGGGGGDAGPAVREQVISDPTTQDIRVFRPDGDGSWPIVMAYHGLDGDAQQMSELGRRLAAEGLLVFAPDVRTDVSTDQGIVDAANDSECAYRYVRTVAGDFGGDLERPVTFVGWSFGANSPSRAAWTSSSTPRVSSSRASRTSRDRTSSSPSPAVTTSSRGSRRRCSTPSNGATRVRTWFSRPERTTPCAPHGSRRSWPPNYGRGATPCSTSCSGTPTTSRRCSSPPATAGRCLLPMPRPAIGRSSSSPPPSRTTNGDRASVRPGPGQARARR